MVNSDDATGAVSPDRRDRRIAWLLWAIALALYAPGLLLGLPSSKGTVGAWVILDGGVPYRDFWTMYAPGQFYAQALLFGVFGREVIVQGIAAILVNAMSCAVFFLLLRRLGVARLTAVVLTSLFWALFFRLSPGLTSYPPIVLLSLLGATRVVVYLQGGGTRQLFFAGLWFGAGALFKHDVAAYFTAAAAVALAVSWFAVSDRPESWTRPTRAALSLGAGAAVVVLPAAAFLAVAAGADVWEDLIVFPATEFRAVRGEAYPAIGPALRSVGAAIEAPHSPAALRRGGYGVLIYLLAHLPEAVFLIAAAVLAFRRRRIDPVRFAAAAFFLCAMPFFWMAAHVQQNTHLYSMGFLSLLLLGLAFEGLRAETHRAGRRLLAAGALVYAAAILLVPTMGLAELVVLWRGARTIDLPGCRGIRFPARKHQAYEPIARFIREHVPPDERIYVGLLRHDVPVITDQGFFVVSQRRSCTRYAEIHPGVVDREEVQREIIESIRAYDVRVAVIWHFGWSEEILDGILERRRAAIPELGATLLDEFVAREFEEIARYGEFSLRWRRGVPRPPGW